MDSRESASRSSRQSGRRRGVGPTTARTRRGLAALQNTLTRPQIERLETRDLRDTRETRMLHSSHFGEWERVVLHFCVVSQTSLFLSLPRRKRDVGCRERPVSAGVPLSPIFQISGTFQAVFANSREPHERVVAGGYEIRQGLRRLRNGIFTSPSRLPRVDSRDLTRESSSGLATLLARVRVYHRGPS